MTLAAIVAFLTAAAARAMPRRENGDVEITRLREENARLRSERDALADALALRWRETPHLEVQSRPARELFDCTADRSHFLLGLQGHAHAQQQHQAMLAQMQQYAAFNAGDALNALNALNAQNYHQGLMAQGHVDQAVREFWGLNDNQGGGD